jgi:adenylate cyclase
MSYLREDHPMERKLAAIFSTDVKGYSRLMGEDEVATIHTLTAYRELMATLIQQRRGRVVDSPGDNLLAEFPSVVEAVQCAVAIQRELRVRNTELPPNRRMEFRIGINLGDVIMDGERIYGDGVNIAARLEGLAEAGGLCISGTVYDQIKTKLALGYEDLGAQAVKNIPRCASRKRGLSERQDVSCPSRGVQRAASWHGRGGKVPWRWWHYCSSWGEG